MNKLGLGVGSGLVQLLPSYCNHYNCIYMGNMTMK